MKVAIIIVTYNGAKWIKRCLESIAASTTPGEIIIVDNNSADETLTLIEEYVRDGVIVIKSAENIGFGKGNNLGIKYAIEKEYDFVLLLNQDAFLMPKTIERLVTIAQENPDYGILSPIHLNGDGNELEYYFSKYMDIELTPNIYFDYVTQGIRQSIYTTHFVNAAAWLLPRNVIETVGGFDPIFWHYGEDNNYGQRVKYHGYKIGVVSECFIMHDSGKRIYSDYEYSERYYQDYVKSLQIRFADINNNYNFSVQKAEKNTLIFDTILNFLKFDYRKIQSNIKKIKMLPIIFQEIDASRSICQQKGSHYL